VELSVVSISRYLLYLEREFCNREIGFPGLLWVVSTGVYDDYWIIELTILLSGYKFTLVFFRVYLTKIQNPML